MEKGMIIESPLPESSVRTVPTKKMQSCSAAERCGSDTIILF